MILPLQIGYTYFDPARRSIRRRATIHVPQAFSLVMKTVSPDRIQQARFWIGGSTSFKLDIDFVPL